MATSDDSNSSDTKQSSSVDLSLEYSSSPFEDPRSSSEEHLVEPYMYEPDVSGSDSDGSAESDGEDSDSSMNDRLGNTNW